MVDTPPNELGAPLEPAPDLGDPLRRIRESEAETKALLARPRLSLRVQLLLGFLVVFLFAVGIAAAIIVSIYEVESRVQLLEVVNEYVFQVDKARRLEKNFFLYDTDLHEALEAVLKAKQILDQNREQLSRSMTPPRWKRIVRDREAYGRLLSQLSAQARQSKRSGVSSASKRTLELRVREQGHRLTLSAQDLMRRQRKSIDATIARSRTIQSYSLVFLLIFMITTAYLISGNIVRSIVRFEMYAERIAAGDFTPIRPTRRYRDEFTNLGLAINHMMQELQKHEAMLIQAHKMRAIGTLTAGVAHELNNPLNNITLTAHMLLEDYDALSDEERQEMATDVVKEVDRAKKIVSNLLDFTRESETEFRSLDLVQLVTDTIDLARNQLKIAGIKASCVSIDDAPPILGDVQQLQQVFLNLLLNAIQASARGGKIQLAVHPADEPQKLAVKVIDYGTGIPKHILTRIFDPFFTTKEKGKGTGLGLSVSQGIIDKHGGRMSVDSRVGKGTTFTVTLPVATIDSA